MNETVITLDVRDEIRAGREPFSTIVDAVSRLEEKQKLLLIVPFEPVPLYEVMAQRGFDYAVTPRDDGDWEVLFAPVAAMTSGFEPEKRPPCSRASES